MKKFSLRSLFLLVVLAAMVPVAIRNWTVQGRKAQDYKEKYKYVRSQNVKQEELLQTVLNAAIRLPTDSNGSDLKDKLISMAGDKFTIWAERLSGPNSFEYPDEDIILLHFRPKLEGPAFAKKHGREKLGESVLIIYRKDDGKIIDSLFTTGICGGNLDLRGWKLSFEDSDDDIIATVNGFEKSK